MVRPSPELVAAAAPYVPVRVLDMRGVDIDTFRFDFDVTFAVLLMNADGTIYHRYHGREHTSADGCLSSPGLARLLRDTLAAHAAYQTAPAPPPARPPRATEQIPPFARRLARNKARGEPTDCIHCHMVHEAEREWAQEEKRWTRDAIFLWPGPERLGVSVDRVDQVRVAAVTPGSPAAAAGLASGDRVARVHGRTVGTRADIQAILQDLPGGATPLTIAFTRGSEAREAVLALPEGWRRIGPAEFAWRPSMWLLTPDPGFGGDCLDAGTKAALGLAPDAFALRIGYLIDWGERAQTGRNARAAGLRKGDVVLAVAGKRDFQGPAHFQAWFRFERSAGETVDVEILRAGERQTIRLPVIE